MTTNPAPPPGKPDTSLVVALKVGRWLVWFTFAFLILAVVILLFAFVFQLTNANETASLVEWVYRSADRLDDPFRSIYPSVDRGNGSVIDFSLLFGVIFYGLLAMFVSALVHWFDRKLVALGENPELIA